MRLAEHGNPKTVTAKIRHDCNVAENCWKKELSLFFISVSLQPCLEDKVQLSISNFVQYSLTDKSPLSYQGSAYANQVSGAKLYATNEVLLKLELSLIV